MWRQALHFCRPCWILHVINHLYFKTTDGYLQHSNFNPKFICNRDLVNGWFSVFPHFIWFKCLYVIAHQVSWIRKRDLHILTVGILTYSSDQRFQSLHQEGSDEWTLKISSPQPRDRYLSLYYKSIRFMTKGYILIFIRKFIPQWYIWMSGIYGAQNKQGIQINCYWYV